MSAHHDPDVTTAGVADANDRAAARRTRIGLAMALAALGALYLVWYRNDPHLVAAYAIFALPPMLLSAFAARGGRIARFLAGVLALLWCSHGVMIAWSAPADRGYALAETALAILIVFAASADGLRERARKRRAKSDAAA